MTRCRQCFDSVADPGAGWTWAPCPFHRVDLPAVIDRLRDDELFRSDVREAAAGLARRREATG